MLQTNQQITWCPGCGNHSIFAALKSALVETHNYASLHNVVVVYGIGCHGHTVNYLKTYGFEGLHGRPIPLAEGIKLAKPDLTVIVIAGDGDTFGEGLAHFIHACRRNINLKLFIHDNRVFGLTTGQTSPTSSKGFISKSTPLGSIEEPIKNLALAITSGASFVAQETTIDSLNLKETMIQAFKHEGLAYLNILQQCVTFNKVNTAAWYQENTTRILNQISKKDRNLALLSVMETKKLPLGILYQKNKPTYESQIILTKKPLTFSQLRELY